MTKIVFVDTETTSLRPDRRAWEIGLIVRDLDADGYKDTEHVWFVDSADLDLGNADPKSLNVGRFYDRHSEYAEKFGYVIAGREEDVADDVEIHTRGAILVGATVAFDAHVLDVMLRRHGLCPSWHYRLFDVTVFAAGFLLRPPPVSFDAMLDAFEVKVADEDRHTALGDARAVRDLYDAVLIGAPRPELIGG